MTYIGRILVIVITALSLIFLGISTVAYTTARDWKIATDAQKKKVGELTKRMSDAQKGVQDAQKELEAAKINHDALARQLDARIKQLEDENKRSEDQIAALRREVGKAQTKAQAALNEADAERKATEQLHEQRLAVEKQAGEFKLRQAELNDKIRELERILETATRNNADLRERVSKYSARR